MAAGVTTTGPQTYDNAVTLGPLTTTVTTFQSMDEGVIKFASTVVGAQANHDTLQINTRGASFLMGDVGAYMQGNTEVDVPLASLIDGPAAVDNSRSQSPASVVGTLTIAAPLVLTSGAQSYEGPVVTTAGTARLNAGQEVNFTAPVNSTGGLTVSGSRIAATGDVTTVGNLDLESTQAVPLLLLGGDHYASQTGAVSFNTATAPATLTPDYTSTIILTSPDKVTISGQGFTMGRLQKILSFGTLDIEVGAGTATLGDIAARYSLTVGAAQVDLLARPMGDPNDAVAKGRDNNGLNFVADNSIDFGRARITFIGTENPTASFITTGANITIQRGQGISLFKDPNVDSQFRNEPMLVSNNGLDAFNIVGGGQDDIILQPVGGGSQALDTAAALSGALPDQKPIDVAADITISASQIDELKKLGIHPRAAERSERQSVTSKRALFAQLVDGEDKENYGRLQPIKGGVSRLEPSDYVVVVDRMSEREVQSILQSFEALYGKEKEKAPAIGGAFSKAYTDYTVEKQTSDPAGFGPYLQSNLGKYPDVEKSTRGFDDLFGHIEHLGLTDKEVEKSEQHIASDLGVAGVEDTEMVKVINSLRKKLPPEKRAPSTKAPPSAPASSPAPGAAAPAPGSTPAPVPAPANKPSPPLKTARQDKVSPHKTARRPQTVRDAARSEFAGL